ncbi:MAG TPA: sulfide/dihydroorotate dehydrogenase-like FAD/NAD-binding protein [Candidatus Aminicenantes bacterium]|nr:sulfide/dihydroorotate dehydrogenase-like FAD/NAD-binding protein [Candidatus Aminicenantes bacterium]HRY65427.1 sulfide/dihydroorotate dehydrogenase-like FAD/NAD-binding protein [Candidatus Aminicenantes bacterium]HRZ72105.1 sulfide/dihydroorotate dehydrogenase-like FAD/NAD-binding protein [Candidatus Aminicenantes bacterium]
MSQILRKEKLAPDIFRMRLSAPLIAASRHPGQFVILRATPDGERIPLTIADACSEAGWIEVIVQVAGAGTMRLSRLRQGDSVADLVGPLGQPTRIKRYGRCIGIAGGVGIAPLYPIAQALKAAGNSVTIILGARSRDKIILRSEIEGWADEVLLATEDGSAGRKGLVSDVFLDLARQGRTFERAVVIGPAAMMRAVSKLTLGQGIPTVVSLNPIMIDGTGLCGGCRVEVDGKIKFACVDGPEFEAEGIDWEPFMRRLRSYQDFERQTRERESCRLMNA